MSQPTSPGEPSALACYRHPNRPTYVRCQRCGRAICGECQTPAPVGFICPECMRQQRATAPRTKSAFLTRFTGSRQPTVTYVIIGICILVFIAQSLPVVGNIVTADLQYAVPYSMPGLFQPWRMITSIFIHYGILHIALNMYTLFIFGIVLEPMLGRIRYLVLFLISGLAGSVGVALMAPPNVAVGGASGAIFGMMAALLIIQRHLGGPITQLLVLVGINLVISFLPGFSIAWQAHVGGLVGGALVGLIYTQTRARSRRALQVVLLVVLAVLLVLVGSWHVFAGV
ncbi:rhomboid family intramembrane serine protease [Humibacter sp.]|uniref:rhomboid family intramembrane serine protease n=1 Tax=Humibacter sp. TaxID=1940291 RepID=UPI003F7E8FFA